MLSMCDAQIVIRVQTGYCTAQKCIKMIPNTEKRKNHGTGGMAMAELKPCPYAKAIAREFDIHIDCLDCWLTVCPYPKCRAEWNRRTDNGGIY